MSQVTIYLPKRLHEAVRAKAEELGVSLSSFMATLAREAVQQERPTQDLLELFGSCEGLIAPEDRPPDPLEH